MRYNISLILFFSFILLNPGISNAQNVDSMRIEQLRQQVFQLQRAIIIKDSTLYEETYVKIQNGLMNSVNVFNNIKDKNDEFNRTKLFLKMLDLNDDQSKLMIKQVGDKFSNLVVNSFQNKLDTPKISIVLRTLQNVFNNPIFQPLINSNPISSSISAAYNLISGLVIPRVDRVGGVFGRDNVRDVSLINVFDNNKLKSLTDSLIPYTKFYDEISMLNNRFGIEIVQLQNKSNLLLKNYLPVLSYYRSLGIVDRNNGINDLTTINRVLSQYFPRVTFDGLNNSVYSNYIQKKEIVESMQYSAMVYKYNDEVNTLTATYNEIYNKFIDDYEKILDKYIPQNLIFNTQLIAVSGEVKAIKNARLHNDGLLSTNNRNYNQTSGFQAVEIINDKKKIEDIIF
jgi:hypothetical protein